MFKKPYRLLLILCALSLSPSAFAETDFILKPYVGYEMGYLTQQGVPEITTQGLNYGARLGADFSGFGVGLDYLMGAHSTKQSSQTGDFKPIEYGLFLGYSSEAGIEFYLTYFLSAKAKIQSDLNPQDFSGAGYKLGIGWRLHEYCEVSLELLTRNYTKYDSAALRNSMLGSSAGLSIAVPLL